MHRRGARAVVDATSSQGAAAVSFPSLCVSYARRKQMERMRAVCAGVGATFGASVELTYTMGYPATVSSAEGAAAVRRRSESQGGTLHGLASEVRASAEAMGALREKMDQELWKGVLKSEAALVEKERALNEVQAKREQLWGQRAATRSATTEVGERLAEHRCRLVARGVRAAPLNDGGAAPRGLNAGCM